MSPENKKLENLEVEGKARTANTMRSARTPEEIAAERELIVQIQGGDSAAFEKLVKNYEKKVFWIAYNLVNHVDDAKDITQDTFLRVFKAIERFNLQYNFYTWLYRIVVNLAIDRLRKRKKQNSVSIEEFPTDPEIFDTPESAMRNSETGQKIKSVLESMPEKYRMVILLRDVHELSCDQIAKIIGCTGATTRWRLHKAREIFKAKWSRVVV